MLLVCAGNDVVCTVRGPRCNIYLPCLRIPLRACNFGWYGGRIISKVFYLRCLNGDNLSNIVFLHTLATEHTVGKPLLNTYTRDCIPHLSHTVALYDIMLPVFSWTASAIVALFTWLTNIFSNDTKKTCVLEYQDSQLGVLISPHSPKLSHTRKQWPLGESSYFKFPEMSYRLCLPRYESFETWTKTPNLESWAYRE